MHGEVKAVGSIEHIRVIQSVIVGDKETTTVAEVPLVVNGRLIEEVAGIMNQDIERNGEVPEKDFIRRISVVLLRHIHRYRNLI